MLWFGKKLIYNVLICKADYVSNLLLFCRGSDLMSETYPSCLDIIYFQPHLLIYFPILYDFNMVPVHQEGYL